MHICRMLEHFWKIHEDTVVKNMREAVARARFVGAEIARGRYVLQNRVGLLVPPCCALHLGSKGIATRKALVLALFWDCSWTLLNALPTLHE